MKTLNALLILLTISIPTFAQLTPCDSAYVGKSVYGIKLVDTQGKVVTLEQYRGKILFIDFWFSKCKPCIKEFPSSKKLRDMIKREDIVFLTINSDKEKSDWLKSLNRFEIEGEHYYDDIKLNDDILYKYFLVRSFPRYWIVDKTGKIVSPNADKPSAFLENNTFLEVIDNVR